MGPGAKEGRTEFLSVQSTITVYTSLENSGECRGSHVRNGCSRCSDVLVRKTIFGTGCPSKEDEVTGPDGKMESI